MNPALQGLLTIAIGVGGCLAYFYFSNLILDKVIFPARGHHVSRNINRANLVRPWLFLFPVILLLTLYLLYPVVGSFLRSLYNRSGNDFIGMANYATLLSDSEFRLAFLNNALWAFVVPAVSTFLGAVRASAEILPSARRACFIDFIA